MIGMSYPTAQDARATEWRKSRYSMSNGNCVEIAAVAASVIVRDSVNPGYVVVSYPVSTWRNFIADAKSGKFGICC